MIFKADLFDLTGGTTQVQSGPGSNGNGKTFLFRIEHDPTECEWILERCIWLVGEASPWRNV